jgi:predicted amidohydrolase YtcJ
MTKYTNFKWWRTGEPQEMLVQDGLVMDRAAHLPVAEETADLEGDTLYPAFIDNHCHILPTGLDLQKLHLGPCQSNQEVLDSVRDRLSQIQEGKWLQAVHYDQTRYGGVFLTRSDLDQISDTVPISLRHVNGHASVVNSAALKAAGIDDKAEDPSGGSYGRFDDGRINGVLFESAHERVTHHAPLPILEEMVEAILMAGEAMAGYGICCASDMMTGRFDLLRELEAYRMAAERGCRVITRLYLQWGEVFRKDGGYRSPEVQEAITAFESPKSRISGIKIFADGAIGSATAAIYGRYTGATAAGYSISRRAKEASSHAPDDQEVSGQLIYTPERLNGMVRTAHDSGYQVAIHTIGDYSTDLVMDAYEQLGDAKRHRIEHAMLLSDGQIERMARLGCFCTMQPEFLMRFGHSYLRQLGPERTSKLERFRSVKDAGIPLSFSSDRPIVQGNPLDGIKIATDRQAPFDSTENVSFEEAIDAYTIEAAKVTGDEQTLGSLEPGQLALWRTI